MKTAVAMAPGSTLPGRLPTNGGSSGQGPVRLESARSDSQKPPARVARSQSVMLRIAARHESCARDREENATRCADRPA